MADRVDNELLELMMDAQRAHDQAAAGQYVDYEVEHTSSRDSDTAVGSMAASAMGQQQQQQQKEAEGSGEETSSDNDEWLKSWKVTSPLRRRNAFRGVSRWRKALDLDAATIRQSEFCGTVTVQRSLDAVPFAQSNSNSRRAADPLAFWTDTAGKWKYKVVRTEGKKKEHLETLAIRSALQTALEEVGEATSAARQAPSLVRVFSDSTPVLRRLCRMQGPLFLTMSMEAEEVIEATRDILNLAWSLKGRGVRLELHWVPRGKVDGSRLADNKARYTDEEVVTGQA
ncbi:hypothetical protein PCL_12800 [Purpureocillium lilacinum]|uniref:RNase H type-1 domain-containing protein n=1 Tax=Purpureocillium lilacinum TaxID=33203 RepID=A0A2U3E7B4_PURLI|nr:hypothetical protein PCL_12800 [Purpureocillium lilacinum]